MAQVQDQEIQRYKEATGMKANGDPDQLRPEQIMELGQPAYPGLTMFKLFRYLLRRIEALEAKR